MKLTDIGTNVFIKGFYLEGNGTSEVVLVPREQDKLRTPIFRYTNNAEYKELVRQLDLQEAEIFDYTKNTKHIVRRTQRSLDVIVSWKVYKRDNYTCRYCGNDDTPLTYDHVKLWENLGMNTVENGVTACRKCNQTRGNTDYSDWLQTPYYKKVSKNLTKDVIEANEALIPRYLNFPERVSKRRR